MITMIEKPKKNFCTESPCLEVSTMKLSDEFNLPIDESPYFSGLFFFEII